MTIPRSDTLTLYIAGPMTGYHNFNYPAFHHADRRLRAAGYTVVNPAHNERPITDPWHTFMRDALSQLLTADGIAAIKGWQYSRGAIIEVRLAKVLGMPTYTVDEWLADAEERKTRESGTT